MKIVKEDLDNLEKVKDRKTTQGIMMKNAEQESNVAEENFKEVAGDPMELKGKKPFLGAEKQETPKEVEIPKPGLEESLFEEAEKHTYYVKFKQNGKPYVVEFDAYNIEGAEQTFLRSFPDIKSRNEYEILSKNGGSLTHNYDENMNEDVNINSVYTIVEEALDNALDNIANVIANRISDYNTDWCIDEPSQETTLLQSEYIEAIVSDLFKNRNYNESLMNEAGGLKDDGILYSTEGEPITFWDKIYAELDGNLSNDNDYKKIIEINRSIKDKYQEISVDPEGNIRVFAPTKDKLEHAINVAKYYDLEYKAGTSIGYNDPEKAFYCTIYIPQDEQELPVEYDAREEKYKNRKTYSQRQKEKEEKKLAKKINKNV